MTKLTTYKLILFLFIGYNISLHASEPVFKKEFTREVHETFSVSPGVKLEIQNKHGDITIDTWNKNEIQVDVLIKVKSSNSEKAQKFMNEIEIDFSSSSSRVSAKTVYPDNNKSWWSSWFGNGKNLDYEVHYTIHAPENMSTALVNKYGNITQASINGDSDVTNKYGDIFYKNVSGSLDLHLGYGKAVVGEVSDSKMQIKYSSIKLLKVDDLEISTKYSDVKIKTCGNMTSYTKYDDYKIETLESIKNDGKYDEFVLGTVGDINIDTKYTDVKINMLNHKGIFDTAYGSVDVNGTGNGLEKITISSKYTGYDFSIGGDFHVDFEGSRTSFHISEPYEKYSSNKDGKNHRIKAYRGSKNGGARISAYMRYGGLDIH